MKTMFLVVMVMAACAVVTAAPVTNAPAAGAVSPATTNPPAPIAVAAIASTNTPVATTPVSAVVTNAPVVAAPAPDPQVGKVLLALAGRLQAAKRFRCEVAFLVNSETEGMRQELSASYALAVERPNRVALRHLKGMAGNTVVCNGKTLTTYSAMMNRYEEREAPKSLEVLSQGVGPMAGNMLFVDNLLRDDVYAAVMDGVASVTYAGRETVDGQVCDHLKFVQDQFDWDMWVASGTNPVVVRVMTDMSKGFTAPGGEGTVPKAARMTVVNRFVGWDVDRELPADTFEFKVPAGARKAESLFMGDDEEPVDAAGITPSSEDGATNAMGKEKE